MLLRGVPIHLRLRTTEVQELLPPADLITHHRRHTGKNGEKLLEMSATLELRKVSAANIELGEVSAATIEHREVSATIELREGEAWHDERQMRRSDFDGDGEDLVF